MLVVSSYVQCVLPYDSSILELHSNAAATAASAASTVASAVASAASFPSPALVPEVLLPWLATVPVSDQRPSDRRPAPAVVAETPLAGILPTRTCYRRPPAAAAVALVIAQPPNC